METFARDTRHRDHHDLDQIARKFICTQVPTFLDFTEVYQFVSDDLNSVNFRAPNVLQNYATLKHMPPQLLSELLSDVKYPKNVAVLNDYVDKVKPPAGKEVLSFFMHGQRKKNLHEHVDALVEDPDERKRLYTAIQRYEVPKHLDRNEMTKAIGNFICEMPIGATAREEEQKEEKEREEEEVPEEDVDLKLSDTPPKTLVEEEHWENPVLKAFKIDAGLSTRFSAEKTMKQILVASCAPGFTRVEGILGKFQASIPTIDTQSHTIDTFPVHHLDHLSVEAIRSIVSTQQARELYAGLLVKPATALELAKTLILIHHPTLGKFVQVSKHYVKPAALDDNVMNTVLGL
jgi:hypothetical protein